MPSSQKNANNTSKLNALSSNNGGTRCGVSSNSRVDEWISDWTKQLYETYPHYAKFVLEIPVETSLRLNLSSSSASPPSNLSSATFAPPPRVRR